MHAKREIESFFHSMMLQDIVLKFKGNRIAIYLKNLDFTQFKQ